MGLGCKKPSLTNKCIVMILRAPKAETEVFCCFVISKLSYRLRLYEFISIFLGLAADTLVQKFFDNFLVATLTQKV